MKVDEIIAGCLRGSKHHFSRLYEKYSYTLYGICLRYTHDEDEAKDILQEGFIKMFRNLETFDRTKGSFEGWMKRIFVNQSIDYFRKNLQPGNKIPAEEIADELPDDDDDNEHDDLSEEQLLALIRGLPAGYRTVFNLYAMEEMSHKEIAQMLGITESTSKSQLFKARKMLQEKIKTLVLTNQNI